MSYPLSRLFIDALCRVSKLEGALEAFIEAYEDARNAQEGDNTDEKVQETQVSQADHGMGARGYIRPANLDRSNSGRTGDRRVLVSRKPDGEQ